MISLFFFFSGFYRDAFVAEHSEAILSAIADLMLTRSPCDMDDPDLLRSIWFLIAVRMQFDVRQKYRKMTNG